MADEIQRLIVEVQNQAKVEALTAAYKAQRETLAQLLELQKQGALNPAQMAMFNASAAGAVQSSKQLEELHKGMKGVFGSQGIMQLSYGLQDFFAAQGSYAQKFNAVANNLQMLAMNMGLGGAWFLGITGLIAGIQAIANNSDAIIAWFKDLPDPATVKAKAEEIKKVADKAAALRATPTPAQSKAASSDEESMKHYGLDKLGAELQQKLSADQATIPNSAAEDKIQKEIDARTAEIENLKKGLGGPAGFIARAGIDTQTAAIYDAQARLADSRRGRSKQEADRILTDAQTGGAAGDAAKATLKRLGLGAALSHPDLSTSGFVGPPNPEELFVNPDPRSFLGGPWVGGRRLPGTGARIPTEGIRVPGAADAKTREAVRQDALRAEQNTPLGMRPVSSLGPGETQAEIERLSGALGAAAERMDAGTMGNRDYRAFQQMEARLNQLLQAVERREQFDASHQWLMQRVQMLGSGPVSQGNYPSAPSQY
jgi:hypothetical protein